MLKSNLFTSCLLILLLTSCSSYQYKQYEATIDKGNTPILDLSQDGDAASVIYFNSVTYRTMGIAFHRLLLATGFDGKVLDGAGRKSLLDVNGYQAIKVPAGIHTLDYCWVSMNALGSGGAKCNFKAKDVVFEAGKNYLVNWQSSSSIKGAPGGSEHQINIKTFISNFDTGEVVYPK